MNGAAVKHCKNAAKAYEALAEAFQQLSNLTKLKAQVNAGSEIWAEVSPLHTKHLTLEVQHPIRVYA